MIFLVSFTDTLQCTYEKQVRVLYDFMYSTKKFGKLERWIWTEKRNTIHFQLAPWSWLVLIAYIDHYDSIFRNCSYFVNEKRKHRILFLVSRFFFQTEFVHVSVHME